MIMNQNNDIFSQTFTNSVNQTQTIKLNETQNDVKSNVTNEIKKQNNVIVQNKNTNNTTKNNTNTKKNITKTANINVNTWKVTIPCINLDAEISEGTDSEVMNEYVGHFENTSNWNGNVALAAHNRGYPVNYFANIKNLKYGDIIKYYYRGNIREYKVEIVTIIADTDWTYLSKTNDNRITLITCVENEPEYRRCIQGVEI